MLLVKLDQYQLHLGRTHSSWQPKRSCTDSIPEADD